MPNKITKEGFQKRIDKKFPNQKYNLIEFNGLQGPCKIECLKCGSIITYNQSRYFENNKQGLCKKCYHQSPAGVARINYTNNTFQEKINDHFGEGKYQVIEYFSARKGAKLICLKCNKEIFVKDVSHITRQKTLCACFKEDKDNCDSLKDIQRKIDEKFGTNEFILLDFKRESNKIKVKHKCGFIRQIDRSRFFDRGRCPQCDRAISHGERNIAGILVDLKVPFETQKTFEDLKSLKGKLLRFDFFVANKYAIEFNGLQHYKSVDYFGGEEAFEVRQFYDNQKEDYCKKNNIPLLIIPYWEIKKVKDLIISFLESNDYPFEEQGQAARNGDLPKQEEEIV